MVGLEHLLESQPLMMFEYIQNCFKWPLIMLFSSIKTPTWMQWMKWWWFFFTNTEFGFFLSSSLENRTFFFILIEWKFPLNKYYIICYSNLVIQTTDNSHRKKNKIILCYDSRCCLKNAWNQFRLILCPKWIKFMIISIVNIKKPFVRWWIPKWVYLKGIILRISITIHVQLHF